MAFRGCATLPAMSNPLGLSGRHIVLGLSGGIACYKSADLVREFTKAGASVQVVMTEAAQAFITPVTMQALSNRPVALSQWDAREANNMAHINLTREADAVIVAPASKPRHARLQRAAAPWHFLNLRPLPHGHGSLRPGCASTRRVDGLGA